MPGKDDTQITDLYFECEGEMRPIRDVVRFDELLIKNLHESIKEDEAELERLRDEYAKIEDEIDIIIDRMNDAKALAYDFMVGKFKLKE